MGPDVRRNLQVNQDGIEGNDVNDKNGWPTPLTDPSNPVKIVVTSGSLGETRDFKAMSTSQQNDGEHSLAEGESQVKGVKPDGLEIKVKVTELDSTD